MLDDPHLSAATLTDILVLARSKPSYAELLDYFLDCVPALVGCEEVEVFPAGVATGALDREVSAGAQVTRHLVMCGDIVWGELCLTYPDGPPGLGEIRRGRLLAEVFGVAILSAGVGPGPSAGVGGDGTEAGTEGVPPDRDDLLDLLLDCAKALDLMPDASTRARLALVASRVAAAVGASSWCVRLVHHGRLYGVACPGRPGAIDDGRGAAATGGSMALAEFPARAQAAGGGAFYADHTTGDDVERRVLVEEGLAAVVGAGGFDLDGRSWVVELYARFAPALEQVPPVLLSLVLAALSFPREAAVPRPMEPVVRAILDRSGPEFESDAVRGIGEAG